MQLLIEIESDQGKQKCHFFNPLLRIGRDPDCDLPLVDQRNVSKVHASIELTSQGVFLSDLQSTNGTFRNRQRLRCRTRLKIGDSVGLGQRGLRLQIVYSDLVDRDP